MFHLNCEWYFMWMGYAIYSKKFRSLVEMNAILILKSTLLKVPAKNTLKYWQCTETKYCDLSLKCNWK